MMESKTSKRLEEIVSALPLKEGLRILEIGCGTGVAAREIVKRVKSTFVLGIDRSAKAIEQCVLSSHEEISKGKVHFLKAAIEDFQFRGDELFDFAFAIRVGALDGRHPEIEEKALSNIAKALKVKGKLFIDGGSPLQEINLAKYNKARLGTNVSKLERLPPQLPGSAFIPPQLKGCTSNRKWNKRRN